MIPHHAEEEECIISALASSSGATIARVNYRASPDHPFPTPIHDVLLGYDWILENLLRDDFSRPVIARLGVCGELVGGSLATTLALTECRLGKSRISAACVNNPIVDWVFPDDLPVVPHSELPEPPAPEETSLPADEDPMSSLSIGTNPAEESILAQKRPKRPPKPPPPTAWQLYGDNSSIPTATLSGERDVLFRRPEDYFDRFASPIHFFRSPLGTLLYPKDDDHFASEPPDGHLDIETRMQLNHYQSSEEPSTHADVPTLARCRAYARIYPPSGTSLTLPAWHITTGTESPLFDQAIELTKMVRRSIARQALKSRMGRVRWHDINEKEKYEAYADGRAYLDKVAGVGLWTQQDNNGDWALQVERVGAWMKEDLKPDFI